MRFLFLNHKLLVVLVLVAAIGATLAIAVANAAELFAAGRTGDIIGIEAIVKANHLTAGGAGCLVEIGILVILVEVEIVIVLVFVLILVIAVDLGLNTIKILVDLLDILAKLIALA